MISAGSELPTALGPLRMLRAGTFAAVAVWLSATAHVLGGGAAPSTALIGLLVLLVAAPAALLAGRRRGPAGITAGLLLLQVGLHSLLGTVTAAPACGVLSGPDVEHSMSHSMP